MQDPEKTKKNIYDEGMVVRRQVLGDAHVDGANKKINEFTKDFQEFITQYAWGTVWTREGLDRKTRSAITITSLIAHGHFDELAMHIRAAFNNGLTVDEIQEIILHSSIYIGVPAANHAFAVANEVLIELGKI